MKLQWYQDPTYEHVTCVRVGPLRLFVAGPAAAPTGQRWHWCVEGWSDGVEQYTAREGRTATKDGAIFAAERAAREWLQETLERL